MKAAEGVFDAVTCLSGPLACYKKEIVLENMEDWLNQKFLGHEATFGDDRSMTNFVLRKHRTSYQDSALCYTIVPNSHKVFLKQQMRWKRSWLRESLIASKFMWKKEPFAALTLYRSNGSYFAPIVVVYNLIYIPMDIKYFNYIPSRVTSYVNAYEYSTAIFKKKYNLGIWHVILYIL